MQSALLGGLSIRTLQFVDEPLMPPMLTLPRLLGTTSDVLTNSCSNTSAMRFSQRGLKQIELTLETMAFGGHF